MEIPPNGCSSCNHFSKNNTLYVYTLMPVSATASKKSLELNYRYSALPNQAFPRAASTLPRLSQFQSWLLDWISYNAVLTQQRNAVAEDVFLIRGNKKVSVGQIRRIDGKWGWRSRLPQDDGLYPTKEQAAIAYVRWAITSKWPNLADRFEGFR